MPTYEYLCEKCGREFEKFQSMSEKPLKTCPKEVCGLKSWGKGRVRKLISAGAGLLFKGSGFYITDYRSEGYKAAAKKESGAASGAETKTAAAGDSKPATAKSETKSTPKPAKEAK
jgi:putative FmdB family regulatory protein